MEDLLAVTAELLHEQVLRLLDQLDGEVDLHQVHWPSRHPRDQLVHTLGTQLQCKLLLLGAAPSKTGPEELALVGEKELLDGVPSSILVQEGNSLVLRKRHHSHESNSSLAKIVGFVQTNISHNL